MPIPLIRSLTSLSDVIVFSAALTGQGGIYHVNEQMPEYWAELFARYGYSPVDYVRPLTWSDKRVQFWYRQNLLMFVKKSLLEADPPVLDQRLLRAV